MAPLPIAFFALATILMGASSMRADDEPLPATGADLSFEILHLFRSKCIECHGPTVKNPKAKFGYVTDLQRVADNSEFVVPFKPDQSMLFIQIEDGEMPPDDSDVPPLTDEQMNLVHQWIKAGATVSAQAVAAAALVPAQSTPLKPNSSALKRVQLWLGRFHPASVHLPIGLILAAALAELILILSGRTELRIATGFCLTVGTIGAVLAAMLGWWNAEAPFHAGKNDLWLFVHRWVGVATAFASVLATALLYWDGRRPGKSTGLRYRIALFSAAVLVAISGFLGGVNVYGIKHHLL
jgi:uncharacterized membrane protein/mono/diheme cytochrome c family protein